MPCRILLTVTEKPFFSSSCCHDSSLLQKSEAEGPAETPNAEDENAISGVPDEELHGGAGKGE